MRDASMTLSDGRSLAYMDAGPAGSPVVMYCHGAPSTRLDLVMFEEAVSALDVRFVAADRPGYGGSSPQPGRRREDWPADVAALADHLGVERFAVLGLPPGGPTPSRARRSFLIALSPPPRSVERQISAGPLHGMTTLRSRGS